MLFFKEVFFKKAAVKASFIFTAFTLTQAVVNPYFVQGVLELNGRQLIIDRPQKVIDVVRAAGHKPKVGDLLDVDKKLFMKASGVPYKIKVNGHYVDENKIVYRDDVINFYQGRNIVESTKSEIEEIIPQINITGDGPYTVVENAGSIGQKLVTKGRASGKVVSARIIKEAGTVRIVKTVERPPKVIALTFDDGPSAYTSLIVKILKDSYATATFFMIGKQVPLRQEIVKEVKEAGFQIGSHSFTHQKLSQALEPQINQELDDVRNSIFPIINEEMRWFRPPYGAKSALLADVAAKKGYRLVNWNIDSQDWKAPNAEAITDQVINAAFPNAIVLLHDGGGNRANTVAALPRIIQTLRGKGYSFVTVDQL